MLSHLKEARGFDFTGYKRTSLVRRMQQRMSQVAIDDYADYIDQLQVDADEFTALFNTILINVTSFFRDPEAWEYLRDEHRCPDPRRAVADGPDADLERGLRVRPGGIHARDRARRGARRASSSGSG